MTAPVTALYLVDKPRSAPSKPKRKQCSAAQRVRLLLQQNRQCGHCGCRGELGPHHIKRVYNGGLTVDSNLTMVCNTCHRFLDPIYNASPAVKLILILQVIGPESMVVAGACRLLFRAFLRSRLDTGRYLSLRPPEIVNYSMPDRNHERDRGPGSSRRLASQM